MSSKLDYLSKYASSAPSAEASDRHRHEKRKKKESKKDKKKKKKNKRGAGVDSGERRPAAMRVVATNLVDEDDFPIGGGRRNHRDSSSENDDDDDEGPVVVESNPRSVAEATAPPAPRGVWKTVATATATNHRAGGSEEAPPRLRPGRHDSSPSSPEGETDRDRRRRYQRHGSDDDEDRGRRGKRAVRHDSDDEDDEDRGRRGKRAVRRDSDNEDDEDRGRRGKRAVRHDSDNDEDRGQRRHDSEDGEKGSGDSSGWRRRGSRRHGSSGENGSRGDRERGRHDSSGDESRGGNRRTRVRGRKQRCDSEESHGSSGDRERRRRHDSDDSGSGASAPEAGARMSSGHKAGLQNYRDFDKSERKIRAKKDRDARDMVDRHGMGETVYRDKDGRKTTEAGGGNRSSGEEAAGAAQRRLNSGRVQREAREAAAKEMAVLKESGFARFRDDERLEESLRNEIRKDDPMAVHALSKRRKETAGSGGAGAAAAAASNQKPVYKGPPPKANRFGIRPGYRWDGIDRGNGFEDKILAKKYSTTRKAEQAYRWSAADM